MNIRQAAQQDAQVLAKLIFSSAPVTLSATFDIDDELSAINFLQTSLSTANGQYGYGNHWVVEMANQVVACVSAWHSELPASFHQGTLTQLMDFYGASHALSVVQASLALQDCIPKPKEYEYCIGHFAVLAQYQRQGIASALLHFMQERGITAGKSALSLDVDATNTQGIDFYVKQGFVKAEQSAVSQKMHALGIGSHIHMSKNLI